MWENDKNKIPGIARLVEACNKSIFETLCKYCVGFSYMPLCKQYRTSEGTCPYGLSQYKFLIFYSMVFRLMG